MAQREPVKRYTLSHGQVRMLSYALKDYMKYCKMHRFSFPKWIPKFGDKLESDLIKMRKRDLK